MTAWIRERLIDAPTTRPRLVALERATARAIRRDYGTRVWATTPLPIRALATLLIARESRRVQRRILAHMLATMVPAARKIAATLERDGEAWIRATPDGRIAQAERADYLPELTWAAETVVDHPEHGPLSVFQMDTYAVLAKWPDGRRKVRVLPRGSRSRPLELPDTEELYRRFAAQRTPVVFEEDETPADADRGRLQGHG